MTSTEAALVALAEHYIEWREDRDMGATFTYCPACMAHGGAPWQPASTRVHKPGCQVPFALAQAARVR